MTVIINLDSNRFMEATDHQRPLKLAFLPRTGLAGAASVARGNSSFGPLPETAWTATELTFRTPPNQNGKNYHKQAGHGKMGVYCHLHLNLFIYFQKDNQILFSLKWKGNQSH